MTKVKEVPFLVIGGGIGGLTAALGMAKAGREVYVLEKASKFAEIGAGLQLAPNAMAVLDQFGLFEAISEYAVFPKRLVLMDAYSGNQLSALDLGDGFRQRYGYPYAVMHRSDLHMVLLEACRANDAVTLLNNQEVENVDDEGSGVRVSCTDGTNYKAQAVVGADGLWSNTRRLIREDDAVCAEYVAYRGAIPTSEIQSHVGLDHVVMWVGPGMHFVQYPIRRKELFNQVAVFKSSRYREDSDDWGTPDELDAHFSQCCDLVRNAVTYIHRDRRWPMYDRDPIDNWTKGRFTLLGDAAHPMLQYLAQGACQALEDGACLGRKLALHDDVENAFSEYQKERIPHTARVQRNARTWGEILHTGDEMNVLLRNTLLSQRRSDDYRLTDWLYQTNL